MPRMGEFPDERTTRSFIASSQDPGMVPGQGGAMRRAEIARNDYCRLKAQRLRSAPTAGHLPLVKEG